MALVIETGAGLATAESYVSVVDLQAYAAARAITITATETQLEAALRYATEWLDGRFEWRGAIAVLDQALGWPRVGASDDECRTIDFASVPRKVIRATSEVAIAHLSKKLNPVLDRGGMVESVQAGPVNVTYQPGAPAEATLPHVRRILRGLFEAAAGDSVVRLVRS